MFWSLILAHFLADYPLQPYRLVVAKRRTTGLLVHVLIHLVAMLVLIGAARSYLWPYLLAVTIIHFLIDVFKNWLSQVRPKLIVGPYLLDQALHFLVIGIVTAWAFQMEPAAADLPTLAWQIVLLGFTLVTFTWHVTERIVMHANPDYLLELNRQLYPRMVVRGLLLTLVLLVGAQMLPEQTLFGLAGFASVGILPYVNSRYRLREISTDVLVALVVALFTLWVL